MTRKIAFFAKWSWFKFINLVLALGINFKLSTSVAKGLKLKIRKFWVWNLTFVEVTGEKLVGGGRLFALPRPTLLSILNMVNILDDEFFKKVQHFLSNMVQYNIIPTIHKIWYTTTRVMRNTATAIDTIITNTVIRSSIQIRSRIIKNDTWNNFPITFALTTCEISKPEGKAQLFINASTEKKKESY